jgi:hypothetical protein
MAETKINVVEKNILLVGKLMRFLLNQPQILSALPESFELIILPDDDPEMRLYNLDLLDMYDSEGKPVVFARMKSSGELDFEQVQASLYVPIAT